MNLQKIRYVNNVISWTVVDNDDNTVEPIRNWIIHLEEINYSPNTIQAYTRHVVRLANYLQTQNKTLDNITIPDYDSFLRWLTHSFESNESKPTTNLVYFDRKSANKKLSPEIKNQIHWAVKSFYRYLTNCQDFNFGLHDRNKYFEGNHNYKPFLEHINLRKATRKKDNYLNGDFSKVQKKVSDYRLKPEQVLELIKSCHLLRDAFLVTLLYNTGMRIGEALGLRHSDIDLNHSAIWIVPRSDNENGARAKSKRTRSIPVLEYVISMYEDYITSDEYLNAFESGTDYVFCNVKKGVIGKALSKSYADNLQKYLKERSKIDFHWHMFRHSHASEAISDGYSLLEVADRLGHLSPQTTVDFYRHLFSSEVRKLHLIGSQKLEERLNQYREVQLLSGDIKWT